MSDWLVLGAGRAGRALGTSLRRAGHRVTFGVRRRGSASALGAADEAFALVALAELGSAPVPGRVLLCVPDDALASVVRALPAGWTSGDADVVVLHVSGAQGAGVLRPLVPVERAGAAHPLVSFAGVTSGQGTEGAPAVLAFAGGEAARSAAAELAAAAGLRMLDVPDEARAVWHLAAVLASNGVFALLEEVSRLLTAAGLDAAVAAPAFARLSAQSAENVVHAGLDAAATGPVVRGDAGTVSRHREAIAAGSPATDALYVELAHRLLAIGQRRGLDARTRSAIEAVLATAAHD